MAKGRKTILEERIEIVEYCIEHGKDYPATIEKYGVSYQQIYSWVRKYEEKGIDALRDGRGRTKSVEEMTDMEKLQAENRLLKGQLRDKEVEMLLLKNCRNWKGVVADRSKAREFVFSHSIHTRNGKHSS